MSLLSRFRTSTPTKRDNLLALEVAALKAQALRVGDFEQWNTPGNHVALNDETAYEILSWVATAVGHTARSCGVQPIQVQELRGEKTEAIDNHPFEALLYHPNPLTSRSEFLTAIFAYLLLTGNAYLWMALGRPTAAPTEMYILPTHKIRAVPGKRIGEMAYYEYDAGDGEKVAIPPWEIVHFKEWSPGDMWTGWSRTRSVGMAINKDRSAEIWDRNFFDKNNAKPQFLLNLKGNMNAQDIQEIERRFNQELGGDKRKGHLFASDQGIDFQQLSWNYVDMEFIKARQFTRDQIYDMYAPGLAGVLAVNSTEANSLSNKATLKEMGMWPLLVAVAEKITNNILPRYGDNLICQFDDVRLPDKAMELQEIDTQSKFMTIGEIRERVYNLDKLGDERDDMLVVQVGQKTILPEITSVETPEPPPQLMATNSGDNVPDEPQAVEDSADGGSADVEAQGTKAHTDPPTPPDKMGGELRQYIRHIKKRMKEGRAYKSFWDFGTEEVPGTLKAAIAGALDVCSDEQDAIAVIEGVLGNA